MTLVQFARHRVSDDDAVTSATSAGLFVTLYISDSYFGPRQTSNLMFSRANTSTYQRSFKGQVLDPDLSEITQCNGHYAVQGHSRSPILVPIK